MNLTPHVSFVHHIAKRQAIHASPSLKPLDKVSMVSSGIIAQNNFIRLKENPHPFNTIFGFQWYHTDLAALFLQDMILTQIFYHPVLSISQ